MGGSVSKDFYKLCFDCRCKVERGDNVAEPIKKIEEFLNKNQNNDDFSPNYFNDIQEMDAINELPTTDKLFVGYNSFQLMLDCAIKANQEAQTAPKSYAGTYYSQQRSYVAFVDQLLKIAEKNNLKQFHELLYHQERRGFNVLHMLASIEFPFNEAEFVQSTLKKFLHIAKDKKLIVKNFVDAKATSLNHYPNTPVAQKQPRRTPFLLACQHLNLGMVRALLDTNEVNTKFVDDDYNGETCLHVLAAALPQVTSELSKVDMNQHSASSGGYKSGFEVVYHPHFEDMKKAQVEILKEILSSGAALDKSAETSRTGETVMHTCARVCWNPQFLAELVASGGFDVNARLFASQADNPNKNGTALLRRFSRVGSRPPAATPLFLACCSEFESSDGVSNYVTNPAKERLLNAIDTIKAEMVQLLLAAGANAEKDEMFLPLPSHDVSQKNVLRGLFGGRGRGGTFRMRGKKNNKNSMNDLFPMNGEKITPLFAAIMTKKKKVTQLLLKNGAKPIMSVAIGKFIFDLARRGAREDSTNSFDPSATILLRDVALLCHWNKEDADTFIGESVVVEVLPEEKEEELSDSGSDLDSLF